MVILFAVAIVVLWRQFIKRDIEREAMTKERAGWDVQEAKIRAECEIKISAAADKYTTMLVATQTKAQEREDEIRHEFALIMEGVADQHTKSSDALTQMLQKFYERFVGLRARY